MIRAIAFIAAVALLQVAAFAQSAASPVSGNPADAAAAAAAAGPRGTFEPIDPDSEIPDAEEAAAVYAGLPPLAAPSPRSPEIRPEPVFTAQGEVGAETEAPRGPAVRMIANPVVQALPAAAPKAAAKPANPPARPGAFVIKSILPVEGTFRYGDWYWDETGAPATGTLVITVDLEARVISAFRDGHEIGTAVTLLGTQSHPTPLGTFPVLNKSRQHFSRKYDNAPMPYSLWLTNTGIAIHGSPVMNGYASHGCIGVPDDFAAKLFAATKRGDKVIITRGKMVGVGDKIL